MKQPDTIYLQVDPEEENELGMLQIENHEGVTWCKDRIFKTDIEYVRKDIFDKRMDRIRELEKRLNDA